ncbi:MAG: hypothetical protein AAGI08_15800 [Bacteroidota bacterium]
MTRLTLLLLAFLIIPLAGCGGDDADAQSQAEVAEALSETNMDTDGDGTISPNEAARAGIEGATTLEERERGTRTTEAVGYEDLQGVLPASVSGYDRTDLSGQNTSAMGMSMSNSNATYSNGTTEIDVNVTDTGTMRGVALMGYQWLNQSYNREGSDGFERTVEYRGGPALEKESISGDIRASNLTVFLAERFIVEVESNNLPFSELRDFADDLPLGDLNSMSEVGVE